VMSLIQQQHPKVFFVVIAGSDQLCRSCMATVLLIHRDSKRVKISLSTT
jgi:hypothetical protein